ncbi:MAG: PAS domain S-box protein [Thermoplasmata archaeon]
MCGDKISDDRIASLDKERINVLLVDDDTEFLKVEKIFLEREDSKFNIEFVDSAEEALKYLEENHIDVIVSDYMMPDMDGLAFLRELREKRLYDIPFILMTGQGREEVAIHALNLGAERYLQKGGDPKSRFGILAKAIVQEVTHHRTEKLLELTKHSVEKADLSIYWIDKDGRFVYVNDAAVKQLGYTKEEFLDMNIWDIDPNYPKERRERAWNELKEKGNVSIETIHQTKEGKEFFVAVNCNHTQYEGRELEFAFAEDIAERKRMEKEMIEARDRYQSLVDNLPGITYRCKYDENWTMQYMSDAVDSIIGYPASDFILNEVRTYESVIHQDDTVFVQKEIRMAVEERKPWDIRYRVVHKDGNVRWVHERGRAVFGEDDEVKHLTGLILDITERKQNEELLGTLYEETSRVNRLMSGREDRIIELKEEVNKLSQELGRDTVYKSVED